MSSIRRPFHRMRLTGFAVAAVVLLGAAFRAPRPEAPVLRDIGSGRSAAQAFGPGISTGIPNAKQNFAMVAIESKSRTHVDVVVFATKSARVASGDLAPGIRSDTLRLRTPTTVTADLAGGEVHIVSTDGSLLDVTAIFRDSPAIKATAQYAHVVLKEGGVGVGMPADSASGADPAYFEFQVEKPVVQASGFGAPAYPAALRSARVQGEVQAQFVVDKEGLPELDTFKILKATNDLFAAAVRSAFPSMRFSAAEIGGKKVRQIVHQSFQFRLDGVPH